MPLGVKGVLESIKGPPKRTVLPPSTLLYVLLIYYRVDGKLTCLKLGIPNYFFMLALCL